MLKRLIILEGEDEYQCDTMEEIVTKLIDDNFYNLSTKEKKDKMEMLAIANCIGEDREIVTDEEKINAEGFDANGKFVIKDELTYILSLLSFNNVVLLERTDANIFLKDIDKSNVEKNYMIVNKFAPDILNNYIKKEG